MSHPRRARAVVHAVLTLDKPVGLSSNAALQRVRRLFDAAKAGHGGTLDPLASGLLPIAFGEATKFLHGLLEADKTYEATLCLGVTTDSGDAEGQKVLERPVTCDDAAIEQACAAMVGPITQVPPMHSALKHQGRPLYAYARAGVVVERAARSVTIHELSINNLDRSQAERPLLSIRVRVSKGTYIRTLAHDLGELLGCGAHLVALRRTALADLVMTQAIRLDALEAMTVPERMACLAPVDAWLGAWPRLVLSASQAQRFVQGQRLVLSVPERASLFDVPAGLVRVYCGAHLLGVADFVPPGLIAPQRVIAASQGCEFS